MGHVGPTINLIKIIINKITKSKKMNQFSRQNVSDFFFFNFYLSKILSSIHGVPTVGFRRVKHKKCSTRRGLRVRTKYTGFHREFR